MSIELIERAEGHSSNIAIVDGTGTFRYAELLEASGRVAAGLLQRATDLREKRVAFLVSPGFHYAAVQWGVWRAGGVAIPLALSHPEAEFDHVIGDSGTKTIVSDPKLSHRLRGVASRANAQLMTTSELLPSDPKPLPDVHHSRRAMMMYTSGTTGKPKGVVHTHASVRAQVTALVEAWEWVPEDRVLLVLPLHHVHGVVNVLTCALWSGACCEILPGFDAEETWTRIVEQPITLFMAVPTIYARLIRSWEASPPAEQKRRTEACRKLRVMVSGSAALPVAVLERWRDLSGHVLLERYGMTEIGMALSNPLRGERVPGSVGTPLLRVEVRLVDESFEDVPDGTPGEILVKGPAVFREYWNDPSTTAASFHEGWFRTGDVAVTEQGRYRILGRQNLDIIQTGGYKVSALEIEEVLRLHPAIDECAVVGVPDSDWGERVCVAAELVPGATVALEELKQWAGERLAPYKLPRSLEPVARLPRNAMGKVTKSALVTYFNRNSG